MLRESVWGPFLSKYKNLNKIYLQKKTYFETIYHMTLTSRPYKSMWEQKLIFIIGSEWLIDMLHLCNNGWLCGHFNKLWLHNKSPTTYLLILCAMYSYAFWRFRTRYNSKRFEDIEVINLSSIRSTLLVSHHISLIIWLTVKLT